MMLSRKFRLGRFLKFSASGLLVLASIVRTSAGTVTLFPVADTFLPEFVSHFPGVNGSSADMVIGVQGENAAFARNRGLIRFDFTSIPTGSVIHAVTLLVNVSRFAQSSPGSFFHLHRMSVRWAESESTWAVRLTGQNWASAGGEAGTEYATNSSGKTHIPGAGTYMFESSPGLVEDVTAWVNLPSTNHGWLIKTEDESVGFTAGRFATREVGPAMPRLTVEYTVPVVRPRIDSVSIEGPEFCLRFQAQTGKSYVVERRDRIEAGIWTVIRTIPPTTPTGPVTVCDPLANGSWFYRLGEQ